MASQSNPHLCPSGDDPYTTVRSLLSMVDELQKHMSPKVENPSFVINDNLLLTLNIHLEVLEERLLKLQDLRKEVQDELSKQIGPLDLLRKAVVSTEHFSEFTKGMKKDVTGITKKISDLVAKVPPFTYKRAIQKQLYSQNEDREDGHNNGKGIMILPGLHENEEHFTKLQAFRQVKQEFMELEIQRKMCLLSFGMFPENREVHRTMLMYWWIGEGILLVEGAEKTVRDVLEEFTEKKLVEPVQERRKVAPSSYKMNPFVHSSVIHISKQIGLFDIYHKGKAPSMSNSQMGKVCLVERSYNQPEASYHGMPSVDQIETVFNVSERNPEFSLNWFGNHPQNRNHFNRFAETVFKSLRVFYLGRWERTQKQYIELRNSALMRHIKYMKNLQVLSFQGISTIRRLESSVCKLHKLIVLDLRECSDLKELPKKIDLLQSLVYLDMTGCYMLEWIPVRLALLKNLEVLKGFVVSDSIYKGVACNLKFFKRLKKLRKLSIEINRDDLGVHQLMEDLVKLQTLTNLKVTWRKDLNIIRAGKPEDFTEIKSLPHQLTKLDLQRFPHEELPTWLHPRNLLHLNKLHIGGGRLLKGFGDMPKKATECAVKILRLTSLPKLKVGWIELKQIYFPNLTFLENYECPRVILTPCDGNGIWRSDQD